MTALRRVTFNDDCYFVEFDLELPVMCIFDVDYECPADATDDDEEYWWEQDEAIIPWYEMEDEQEIEGYTWDDLNEDELYDAVYGSGKVKALSGGDSDFEGDWTDGEDASSEYDELVIEDESFTDDDELPEELVFGQDETPIRSASMPAIAIDNAATTKRASLTIQPLLDGPKPKPPLSSQGSKSSLDSSSKGSTGLPEETPNPNNQKQRQYQSAQELPTYSRQESVEKLKRDSSHSRGRRSKRRSRSKSRERRKHYEWVKPDWTNSRGNLKSTGNASRMDHGKLEAPTTFPNKKEDRSINELANPNKLRSTQKGRLARKGINLAKPVTHINRAMNDLMDKKLMWSKPDWAKKKALLKKTEKGSEVKQGKSLNRKIDEQAIKEDATLAWKKPEWAIKKVVKSVAPKGEEEITRDEQKLAWKKPEWATKKVVRSSVSENERDEQKLAWEKPEWAIKKVVKSTTKGEALKQGASLARSSTKDEQEKIAWEKPDWAKPHSDEEGRRLSSPIEQRKEYSWEKPDWVKAKPLRSTKSGERLQRKGDLEKKLEK